MNSFAIRRFAPSVPAGHKGIACLIGAILSKTITLTRLCFDYQTTLLIATTQSSLTVVIEMPFTLRRGSLSLSFNEPQDAMLEMGSLLHKPVLSLTAFRNNTLLIKFEAGMEIEVQ